MTISKVKKIIIALIFILLCNFVIGSFGNSLVLAANNEGDPITDEDVAKEGGGRLLLPIQRFVLFISDSIINLFQNNFISKNPVTIKARGNDKGNIRGKGKSGIYIGLEEISNDTICAIGSNAIAQYADNIKGYLENGAILLGGTLARGNTATSAEGASNIKGAFDLPTIQYTPERIFSNDIPLFNINFFDPEESEKVEIKEKPAELIETNEVGHYSSGELRLY